MTLHLSIDEAVLNWNDYIYSDTNPNNSPVVMPLATLTELAGAATGQIVVVDDKLGTGSIDAIVELRQGYVSESSLGTLIKTLTDTDAVAGTLIIPLSAAEYDTIVFTTGSAANLSLRIVAHAPADSGVFIHTVDSGDLLRAGHSNGAAHDGEVTSTPGGTAGQKYWWTVTTEDIGGGNVTVRLYRDTTLLASGTKPAFTGTIDRLSVANLFGGGRSRGLDTTVYAVRVYDRRLTDTEIGQLGVLDIPSPPTANAGPDVIAQEGAMVTLDGSQSSDLETPFENLVFAWTVTNAGGTGLTTGDLMDANTPMAMFEAPDVTVSSTITLTLTVTNQVALSNPDTVAVTVNPAPVVEFPDTILPVTVELLLAGVWTDVTAWLIGDDVTITRGRQDWASQVDPSTCTLKLRNDDGRFSPRNPLGPYYGKLGRNTQIRVTVVHAIASRRFWGEVSSWPQEWNTTGTSATTQITAAGILRRLSQSVPAVKSVLKRQIPKLLTDLVGYWPLEDEPGRKRLASGLSDGSPMTIRSDVSPELAAYDGFDASAPILRLNDADIRGTPGRYTFPSGGAVVQLGFLLHVGDSGSTSGQTLIHLEQTGTAAQWEIRYESAEAGGALQVRAKDRDGVEILNSGNLHENINGDDCLMILRLKKEDTVIRYELYKLMPGQTTGVEWQGSLSGNYSLGRAEQVIVNSGGGHSDVAIGHITVQSDSQSFTRLADALKAYEGETAARRIQRLCSEHNLPFRSRGDLDKSERMGPQRVGALLELLQDAAHADAGMLGDARDAFAVFYRTRESLYNQELMVEFDYQAFQLSPPLQPVEDDQDLRNDVTATGPEGEARAVLTTGALSIQDPPNGVGVYEDQIDCNCEAERFLDAAWWRVTLGTVDEARYPVIYASFANPFLNPMAHEIMSLDVGDRITIDNLPSFLPPGPISVLVQGYEEVLKQSSHDFTWNCSPYSPYQVGAVGSAQLDADGSTLATQVSVGATSMSVAGPLWSTSEGLPTVVRVAGIDVTVTAITGASSPQTFTVTGATVTKILPSGSAVTLATPARAGL